MKKLAALLLAGAMSVGVGGRVLAAEGESGQEHKTMKMGDLPKPVQTTLKKEAKGGKVEEVTKAETRSDGTAIYKAEVVKKGKGTEIEVDAHGMVVEKGKPHSESSEPSEHGNK